MIKGNPYKNNQLYSVGIEEEYMLCNPETGDLVNKADLIMDSIDNISNKDIVEIKKRFSYELILSEIETNTSVCSNVTDAIKEVSLLRKILRDLGENHNYRLGISGTHPTANPNKQSFVQNDSYKWVRSKMKEYARQNMTFSTHIHIGVNNPELMIKISNAARCWIAPLLAISVNSPFFNNVMTGMQSSRTFQFGNFPRTNIPSYINDINDYTNIIDSLKSSNSIDKPRHIWWKIRPHIDFGTIEFRMCDAQRSLLRVEMLAAICQSLVHAINTSIDKGECIEDFSLEFLNDGLWSAASEGISGKIINPLNNKVVTMKEYINTMLDFIHPSLLYFGNENIINIVNNILQDNTESQKQLDFFNKNDIEHLKLFLMDDVEYDYK